MTDDDATHGLTRAIASGDTEAFARLYEEWFDAMYACARQATRRDEHFCLDAVQEAFLRVIRKMRPIPTRPELGAWLRRVTLRCCIDAIRREQRTRRRHADTTHQGAGSIAELDRAALERVHQALRELDEREAALIEMRYRFGWTLDRIGKTLGLRPGAVDGRLGRATAKLKDAARRNDDE